MKHEFTVETLAEHAGCTVQMIRNYEREGLLPAPKRILGNYRLYDRSHINRLSFIRNCRAFDMKVPEIKQLLGILETPIQNRGEVAALIGQRLDQVEERITELRQLQRRLSQLLKLGVERADFGHRF